MASGVTAAAAAAKRSCFWTRRRVHSSRRLFSTHVVGPVTPRHDATAALLACLAGHSNEMGGRITTAITIAASPSSFFVPL